MIQKMKTALKRRNLKNPNPKWSEKELKVCQVWYLKKLKINENLVFGWTCILLEEAFKKKMHLQPFLLSLALTNLCSSL